jgi:hypothetical protein
LTGKSKPTIEAIEIVQMSGNIEQIRNVEVRIQAVEMLAFSSWHPRSHILKPSPGKQERGKRIDCLYSCCVPDI